MTEKQEIKIIEVSALSGSVKEMSEKGWRMVQISCSKIGETLELSYSFDKDYEFISLRLVLPLANVEIPSVSGIYFCAFLYENEIHDLYGIKFRGLLVDFKGNLYRTHIKTAFNVPEPQKGGAQ